MKKFEIVSEEGDYSINLQLTHGQEWVIAKTPILRTTIPNFPPFLEIWLWVQMESAKEEGIYLNNVKENTMEVSVPPIVVHKDEKFHSNPELIKEYLNLFHFLLLDQEVIDQERHKDYVFVLGQLFMPNNEIKVFEFSPSVSSFIEVNSIHTREMPKVALCEKDKFISIFF